MDGEKPTAGSYDAIETADKFLKTMAKAIRGRSLYPRNHPQVKSTMEDLGGMVPDLFRNDEKRTFVFIEEQVYIDDRLISGMERDPSEIAGIFMKNGIEMLTLRSGLDAIELSAFIENLSAPEAGKKGISPFASPHIRIGEVALGRGNGDESTQGSPGILSGEPRFSEETDRLKETYLDWKSAHKSLVMNVDKIMQSIEKTLFENIQSFIPLCELKEYDEYTYVHAINLSILTMAQAQYLGFSRESIHAFGLGALLHDVGKTQVSVAVLNKKGKLTPEEFAEMKRHPVQGALMLMQYPEIPPAAIIVTYEHHLKYDRSGYPAIQHSRPQHIGSRLAAIADQFDAMRSNRPYRPALAPAKIIEIMRENSGTDLDPELLDHFIAFMRSRKAV
jgi:HD domain